MIGQPRIRAGRGRLARAAMESPSHLRDHGEELTVTLLAALVYCRTWEITGALVTLLLRVVHAIGAGADRRVTKQLVATDLTYYPAGETVPGFSSAGSPSLEGSCACPWSSRVNYGCSGPVTDAYRWCRDCRP